MTYMQNDVRIAGVEASVVFMLQVHHFQFLDTDEIFILVFNYTYQHGQAHFDFWLFW